MAHTAGIVVGGASIVGVTFGMARYAFGFTLTQVQAEFALGDSTTGAIAGATFVGYVVGLLGMPVLAARRGPRAATTVGGLCCVVGAGVVATAGGPLVLAVGAVLAGSGAGWVWAPYSDIVASAVEPRHRPTVLAAVTTGTSAGLVALGLLGLAGGSWRWIWLGTATLGALAVVLNHVLVPAPAPRGPDGPSPRIAERARALRPALVYSVVYFAVVTVYFTYVGAAVAGSGRVPTGWVYVVIGLSGLLALATGRFTSAVGVVAVAVGALAACTGALLMLATGADSPVLASTSAAVFGIGFMVGSSVLAIWTSRLVPDRPGQAFTVALVLGAVTSVLSPPVVGALLPVLGLRTVLLLTAATGVVGMVAVGGVVRASGTGRRQ